MRIQEKHLHAVPVYKPTSFGHFWWLFYSLYYARKKSCLSVTQHLPFELEHPQQFNEMRKKAAFIFVLYGELLKRLFGARLYWENSPVLNVGIWDLRYGQTDWKSVPSFIDLTLDTGHIMLGAKNKDEARGRIIKIFALRGSQIKHLHVHENDFKTDLHLKPFKRLKSKRVIERELFEHITRNRSYIFEDPS